MVVCMNFYQFATLHPYDYIFSRYDAVIHFAALKAVGESVAKPSLYYNNNLVGTIKLYEYMAKYGCKMVLLSFVPMHPTLYFCVLISFITIIFNKM